MAVRLRNPHSVLEALKVRPRDVVEVRLSASRPTDAWQEVAELAASHRIPVLRSQERRDPRRPTKEDKPGGAGRVGGAEATVKERADLELQELYSGVTPQSRSGLWLALDQLQDPHNVGAIFRTAAFFGVRGIVMTQDRSAPLSATVYDVASGGIEHVPFSIQPNLARSIEVAKETGLWALGTSEHAETDLSAVPRDRAWLLVVGNEERGLRRLTTENCDMLCRIAPQGAVGSLNVSVAAGIFVAALSGGVA